MFYKEEGPFKSSNPELLDNGDWRSGYAEVKAAGGGSGNGGGSSSK